MGFCDREVYDDVYFTGPARAGHFPVGRKCVTVEKFESKSGVRCTGATMENTVAFRVGGNLILI